MKTIVWDVDDVLNNLMQDWFVQNWCKSNPECSLKYTDIISNPPEECLNISFNEYIKSLDEFRLENALAMEPVPEVLEWFTQNGHNYYHIALTAVPVKCAHLSAAWVLKHFGTWIRSFNVIPSPRSTDPEVKYHKTKKDFLKWFKLADVLVDDNIFNIDGAKDLGIKTVLFPRPWNTVNLSVEEALRNL